MTVNDSVTDAFKKLESSKQERVFASAINEFSEQGYRKASMNTICKSAEVSKGSLFHYFTSKSGLFGSILDLAIDKVKAYLREVRDQTSSKPFFERIEILIRSGFKFIDNHPRLARIYFHLLMTNDSPSGSQMVTLMNRQSRDFLSEIIRAGIQNNDLRADLDIEKTSYFLNVIMEHLLRSYYSEYLAPDLNLYQADAQEIDKWITSVLDFIRQGIKP